MGIFLEGPRCGRLISSLLILCLATAHPAWAVVKNVQIVNAAGQPVASQTVTITFPDGTQKEEKTDDKGMLIFDFPDDGDYKIGFPGGSTTVTVAGGIPGWAYGLGAAAAAAGIAVAASDSSSSYNNGGGGGGAGPLDGDCTLAGAVGTNPDMHPDLFTGAICIFTSTSTTAAANCSGAGMSVSLTGSLNSSAETFALTGTGTYAGFTGTGFTFGGGYNPTSLVVAGSTSAGTNGNLPDSNSNSVNEPIMYAYNCTLTSN